MDQLFIRELMNVALAIGSFGAFAVTLSYLAEEVQTSGWYNSRANKLAVGMSVYFVGEAIYRTWAAVLLWSQRTDLMHSSDVETFFRIAVVGFVIASIGQLCTIRLLSKPPGNWAWFTVYCLMWAGVIFARRFG